MAGGNLGDLWFQLGVKDNTSKELQKIIDKLKTVDTTHHESERIISFCVQPPKFLFKKTAIKQSR